MILRASPMHDVGKIGIPDSILQKPGKLTLEERAVMEQHTLIGARILGNSSSPLLQAGETIALSHHEKWDGSGYPNGLSGEAIPLYGRNLRGGRCLRRTYQQAALQRGLSNGAGPRDLRQGRGVHFDPRILDVFFARFDEVLAIMRRSRTNSSLRCRLPPEPARPGSPHHEHRTVGVVQHMLAHASEQKRLPFAQAPRAHHDEVRSSSHATRTICSAAWPHS